jgi:hypothetical protein
MCLLKGEQIVFVATIDNTASEVQCREGLAWRLGPYYVKGVLTKNPTLGLVGTEMPFSLSRVPN